MKPPVRWSEDDQHLSALERDLLAAGRSAGPNAKERAAVWSAIAAGSGVAATSVTLAADQATSSIAATSSASGSLLTTAAGVGVIVKFVAVVGIAGVLVVAGLTTWKRAHHANASAPNNASGPIATAPPAAIATSSPTRVTPENMPPAAESDVAPNPPQHVATPLSIRPDRVTAITNATASSRPKPNESAEPTSDLAKESLAIRQARQAIRDGEPARAVELMRDAQRQFDGNGQALRQEREAVAIEALVRAGGRDEAKGRAAEFLRRYPDSPYAQKIRLLAFP